LCGEALFHEVEKRERKRREEEEEGGED